MICMICYRVSQKKVSDKFFMHGNYETAPNIPGKPTLDLSLYSMPDFHGIGGLPSGTDVPIS